MSSDKDLVNAELRRRLEEAEDTLRAIRDGEVDALVVRGALSEEIFTLEAPESYRSFMEAMNLGAAALDSSFRLIYANRALCESLGRSFEALQKDGLFAALDTASAGVIRKLAQDASSGRQSAEIHLMGEGRDRHLLASATPLQLGPTLGIAITFTDLTERVRATVAEAAEKAARAIITSANEAVVVCDAGGVITHINPAVRAICAEDPIGRRFEDAINLVFAESADIQRTSDLLALANAGQSVRGAEAALPDAPKVRDALISAAPLVVGEESDGCVVTLVDLSQRKAAERQQQLLMGELDHRVRNTLALVLSISTLTGYNAKTVEDFQHAFVGRVEALAATHTLLAGKSWSGLSIEDVVIAELAPYIKADTERVQLDGLNVTVTPQAAVALGLVFHELVTNAVKYGALSAQAGRISIRARRGTEPAVLHIEWVESDGPTVAPPTRSGFGRTVITRSLSYSDGGAEIDFQPAGVICRIRVPKGDLTNEAFAS